MSGALIAVCLWVIVAHVLALIPSRDNHWARAYALIAAGIPIVGWVTVSHGPLVGLVALAMGASVLRWPLIHLFAWTRGRLKRRMAPDMGPDMDPEG